MTSEVDDVKSEAVEMGVVVGNRRGSNEDEGDETRLIFCWKHDSMASNDVMLQLEIDALES